MANKHAWLDQSLDILEALQAIVRTSGREAPVTRQRVEEIFALNRRAAQILMKQAGAVEERGAYTVRADLLITLVEVLGGRKIADQEKARRKAMWKTIDESAARHKPGMQRVFHTPDSGESRRAAAAGIRALPAGVEIGPGFVRVQFETADEAVLKLFAMAQAIGGDFQNFEQAVRK